MTTDRVGEAPPLWLVDAPGWAAELFKQHSQSIYRYAARRVGTVLAQDIVADSFRVAIEGAANYSPEVGNERAWLFGIATNLLRRRWRTEQRRFAALARSMLEPGVDADASEDVDSRLDTAIRLRRVMASAADLSPEDRDLLVLVAWEGLSYRDAAEALAIPAGTVGSRLHRIRASLQKGTADDR